MATWCLSSAQTGVVRHHVIQPPDRRGDSPDHPVHVAEAGIATTGRLAE
ncbi:MAG TPA: hypothetical protein VHC04_04880 [Rhodopila sp.]|nr:hypothetical protein [Rhodopila sp.]